MCSSNSPRVELELDERLAELAGTLATMESQLATQRIGAKRTALEEMEQRKWLYEVCDSLLKKRFCCLTRSRRDTMGESIVLSDLVLI